MINNTFIENIYIICIIILIKYFLKKKFEFLITKPVPIDFPRATIPFRTSNAYQIFSEGKNFI